MQPIRILENYLNSKWEEKRYLLAFNDLRSLFPDMSDSAYKTLFCRAAKSEVLTKICRGIYMHERSMPHDGLVLFHIASLLRSNTMNYISLETSLSDVGIISQVPINYISIVSSGRSNIVDCGRFGHIEFVHTNKKPKDIAESVVYDKTRRLWSANISLALKDMKRMCRNLNLINWDMTDEFI